MLGFNATKVVIIPVFCAFVVDFSFSALFLSFVF